MTRNFFIAALHTETVKYKQGDTVLEGYLAYDDAKEMQDASVDYKIVQYPGAVHGFTNEDNGTDVSKGAAYNKEADEKSWVAMQDFFAEIFR